MKDNAKRKIKNAKRGILFLQFAICILHGALVRAESAEQQIQRAERAWRHRDRPGQTEAAIAAWEKAIKEDPTHPGVYIALTKACGRAYRHSETPLERQHWADEGRIYGALAIANNSSSPDAYAEYGAALGQWAEAHKGVHSLHAVREAIINLTKALELNPRHAYAHMLLAEFYRQSPGWPISVGNMKKALAHAQFAVQYGPEYAINHLILAKVYISMGKKPEAKQELEKILTLPPPDDAAPETRSDQATARELLKSL
jgi:tetratricopeptide (TPR) repeat protein